MKKILGTCLLMALLAQSALAQNGPRTAEQTAKIADILYQAMGPDGAAVFYEPYNVLVLSGRIPQARIRVPESTTGYQAVASKLQSFGLLLTKGEDSLNLVSLDGLRVRCSGEVPEGVEAWPENQTLSDFETWEWTLRDKVRAVHGDSFGDVYYPLMAGHPNQAISARIKSQADPVLQETTINVRIPYSDILAGDDPEFRVLSTDAQAKEVLAWGQERGELLKSFYSLEQVKDRLNSVEFIQARAKDKTSKLKGSPREKWLQGESYGAFELEPSRIYTHHERVLAESLAELEELVSNNEPPYRWIALLNSKLTPEELSTPFRRSILRRLIWTGAYPSSPARQALYRVTSETRPEFLKTAMDYEIESWGRASKRNDSYLVSDTLKLFKHPRFRLHFAKLSATEQAHYLQTLEVLRDDVRIRLLLGESPYRGE